MPTDVDLDLLSDVLHRPAVVAEPDSTLTPAQLSREIQATRRTIPVVPGTDPDSRLSPRQSRALAVRLLEMLLQALAGLGVVLEAADLVTEMREVKHPFTQGIQAQPGIEF